MVPAPRGCHPSYAQGYYDRDNSFYLAWDAVSRDAALLEGWLDEWVYAMAGPDEYAAKVGAARWRELTPEPALSGTVDYGSYR